MKPCPRRIASAWLRQAETTPLPDRLPDEEIGMMTLDEFLAFRNPQGKHHAPDSYDVGLDQLNQDYHRRPLGTVLYGGRKRLRLWETRTGYEIVDPDEGNELVGVIHKGTLFHSPQINPRNLTSNYIGERHDSHDMPFDRTKVVKYLTEVVAAVSDTAAHNLAKYDYLLQRTKVRGESLEVRSEGAPQPNKGTSLAIINSKGLVVAEATDEWGATLLRVAKEFRGMGLGKLLGRFWYDLNPNMPSGGFTPSGEGNAIRLWKDRVREFLAMGWYSELIRQGRMTVERFREITQHLGERPKRNPLVETPKPKPKRGAPLIMIEPGMSFHIYDPAVYDQPASDMNPDLIYGYGFFRSSGDKVYLFTLDYERRFHKLATYIALQMARDAGYDKLWNGEGYSDLLELEGLDHVAQEGPYVWLTQDVLPLRKFARVEQATRRKYDPYDEYMTMIMETADWKW